MRELNVNEINAVSGAVDEYNSLAYAVSEIDFAVLGGCALIVGSVLLAFCCIKSYCP